MVYTSMRNARDLFSTRALTSEVPTCRSQRIPRACSHEPNGSGFQHLQEKARPRRFVLQSLLLWQAAAQMNMPSVAAAALQLSDEEWRKRLSNAQFRVLRQYGTELPFTSKLNAEKRPGTFRCGGCGNAIFSSKTKFDSGTGWPSFYDAIPNSVKLMEDRSIPFYTRTEVACANCNGHLGHVFQDGPAPTGVRRR